MKKNIFLMLLIPLLFSCAEEKITSIQMRVSECKVEAGKTLPLFYSYTPANLDRPIVQWTSSNSDIVKITNQTNESCVVTGKQIGSAIITCTELSTGNRLSSSCRVTVYTTAEFNTELISLVKGTSANIYDYVTGIKGQMYWSSDNPKICYVEYGTLYAKEVGECIVTGRIENSNAEITCKVEVTNVKPTEIICESNLNFFYDAENESNNYYTLEYSLVPQDAVAEVTLVSYDQDIIEVIEGNRFIVKQAGDVMLSLSTDNGLTEYVQVSVSDDITSFVSGYATILGAVRINGQLISGYLTAILANHTRARVSAVEYTLYVGSTVWAHQYYNEGSRPIVGIGQPNGEQYEFTRISCSYIDESSCWVKITYEYNGKQYNISKY